MINGISEQEARQKLENFGPNDLKDETYRSLPHLLISSLREPMLNLLLGLIILWVAPAGTKGPRFYTLQC